MFKIAVGFLVTCVVAVLMLIKLPAMEGFEAKLYDYRFKVRGYVKPPENVVIAAIDEKSIEKLGRWPWSREKIANLVKRLTEDEAELIVMDVWFSEPEKNDPLLARAIREAGNVILPVAFQLGPESKAPDERLLAASAFRSVAKPEMFGRYAPVMAKGALVSIAELTREAMALGHINMFAESDGTLRWEAMAVELNGYFYPSIDLQAAARYLGVPPEKVTLVATEGIRLGEKRYIPTDTHGRMLIHYYGETGTFHQVSISDILDGTVSPDTFKGKIILVGATAVGIYDLRVTPFSPEMSGIEKHANVISSILDNRFLAKATPFTNFIFLFFSGFLFSFLVARMKAVRACFLTAGFFLFVLGLGYYLFVHEGVWLNLSYPASNILLVFVSTEAYNYAVSERYGRRIRAMFSSYVTERVVSELIKNPGMAKLGGERREVTVLFSDLKGFTSFSEHHTPEEVVSTLNEYLAAMTDVIFRWEGTLDKFIGDAILAFWGAPLKQENHAELGIRCALHMIKRLGELQAKWRAEGKPLLDSGIGINTGNVLVGNIGAEGKKMDYTVIGDHVNLGSRVETLTRKYDAHILITEFTMDKIKETMKLGGLGHLTAIGLEKVVVKGKDKEVGIYKIKTLDHGEETKITAYDEKKIVYLEEK